jgi:glycosyltransferase involved in cell wall biosynthesis
MTVVALSYCYPPLRYPRSIQVARLIAHMDGADDVHVVCAGDDAPLDPSLERAYGGAAPVTRVPWSTRARVAQKVRDRVLRNRLLVPDRDRSWVRSAVRATEPLLHEGDVLVTFGQPMSDHLAGLRLKRRGVRWVAHFSDPWVDSSFRRADRLTLALNRRLERAVVHTADVVVFTSRETVDLVMAKYPDEWRAKIVVLPHAYDPALYPEPPARDDDRVVLRYIGNFYGHRGPGPLFAALQALLASDPLALDGVTVELVGAREHPLEVPSTLPDGLVRVRDSVEYGESLRLMRSSDVLLVLDAPGARSVFLPSKLIDYLGARRPILALTPPGAAAELVREAGGWVADPADLQAGADAVAAALAAVRADLVPQAPDELLERYEARRVARQFTAFL